LGKEFSKRPKFFKLRPIILNYVQYIFLVGEKKFRESSPPPGYGLAK